MESVAITPKRRWKYTESQNTHKGRNRSTVGSAGPQWAQWTPTSGLWAPPWDRLTTPIIYPTRAPIRSAWATWPQLGVHGAGETTSFFRIPTTAEFATAVRAKITGLHGMRMAVVVGPSVTAKRRRNYIPNGAGRVGRNCSNSSGPWEPPWGLAEDPNIFSHASTDSLSMDPSGRAKKKG